MKNELTVNENMHVPPSDACKTAKEPMDVSPDCVTEVLSLEDVQTGPPPYLCSLDNEHTDQPTLGGGINKDEAKKRVGSNAVDGTCSYAGIQIQTSLTYRGSSQSRHDQASSNATNNEKAVGRLPNSTLQPRFSSARTPDSWEESECTLPREDCDESEEADLAQHNDSLSESDGCCLSDLEDFYLAFRSPSSEGNEETEPCYQLDLAQEPPTADDTPEVQVNVTCSTSRNSDGSYNDEIEVCYESNHEQSAAAVATLTVETEPCTQLYSQTLCCHDFSCIFCMEICDFCMEIYDMLHELFCKEPPAAIGARNTEMDVMPQARVGQRLDKERTRSHEEYIYGEPTKDDVLMGRGAKNNKNPGNRRWLAKKNELQPRYKAALKGDKGKITRELIDFVPSNGGRYLERVETPGTPVECKYKQIVNEMTLYNKASQALRDSNFPEAMAAKRQKSKK
jgi:hypothetical protein